MPRLHFLFPGSIGVVPALFVLVGSAFQTPALHPSSVDQPRSRRAVVLVKQQQAELVRYHFDDPIALELDADRIAVWAPDGIGPELPLPFVSGDVEPLAIPGWQLLRLREPVTEGELPFLLDGLAERLGCEFVSPVFVDDLGGPLIPGREVLVRFDADVSARDAEAALRASGTGTVLDRDWGGMSRAYRVRSDATSGLEVLVSANALALRSDVRFAEPDFLFTGRGEQAAPNDPDLAKSWGLASPGFRDYCLDADWDMGAFEAWEVTQGDPSVRVLVLDCGVDPLHPDLNQDPGEDFTGQGSGGAPFNACDDHGTRVAGVISMIANNGIGSAGIAPGCKIVSARAFITNTPSCSGWTSNASWTVDALDWGVVGNGILITNNSNLYGFTAASIEDKYDETRAAGAIHFAAGGNTATLGVAYPARIPSVHAVRPFTYWGYAFGNWGPEIEFCAPGNYIWTTDRVGAAGAPGDYLYTGGSSLASPYAAGVAALLRSSDPTLGPGAVFARMRTSAYDLYSTGWDQYSGWGLIRANHALALPNRTKFAGAALQAIPSGPASFPSPPEVRRTCERPSFSADGRFAVFSSSSDSLVAGDTNGYLDIFVCDLQTQQVTRVSVDSLGAQANGGSRSPQISGNGRYVVFESYASNLVPLDTNGVYDVFVHDLQTGSTSRVSVGTNGAEGFGGSFSPSITPDGRYVAFQSYASNFDPLANGNGLAYVRDTVLGTTTLVGQSTGGVAADANTHFPMVSDDGQRVAYFSAATNLVAGAVGVQAYVYDLLSSTCFQVSVDDSGAPVLASCFRPTISGDGNRVTFWTDESLHLFDSNGQVDLYVRDIAAGRTYPASCDDMGNFGASDAYGVGLSYDGRYVVVLTASPLDPSDTNGVVDAYRKDLLTGAVLRVSMRADGTEAQGGSTHAWISPDGGMVGFVCADDELAPGDALDSYSDVYLRTIATATTVLASPGS